MILVLSLVIFVNSSKTFLIVKESHLSLARSDTGIQFATESCDKIVSPPTNNLAALQYVLMITREKAGQRDKIFARARRRFKLLYALDASTNETACVVGSSKMSHRAWTAD